MPKLRPSRLEGTGPKAIIGQVKGVQKWAFWINFFDRDLSPFLNPIDLDLFAQNDR